MKILGIDASKKSSGFALLDSYGGPIKLVSVPIPTDPDLRGLPQVLRFRGSVLKVADTALALAREFNPDIVALEPPYVGVNGETTGLLYRISGGIWVALRDYRIEEALASTWRSALGLPSPNSMGLREMTPEARRPWFKDAVEHAVVSLYRKRVAAALEGAPIDSVSEDCWEALGIAHWALKKFSEAT